LRSATGFGTLADVHRSVPILLASALWFGAPTAVAGADEVVDLELALAVDASGSVNEAEFALQLAGIAAAFRDPAVHDAIGSGPLQRIAVSMVVWADATTPKDDTGWFTITDAASAERFASLVERYPRRVEGGTGIGSGIAYAIRSMRFNGIDGTRRVVDVSGDGIETPVREYSVLLRDARNMARSLDVTINGLAITNEVRDLDDYFNAELRTGPGSFVIETPDYQTYAAAIREKLLKEIASKVALRQ
jgi:hypothetical protein